MPSVKSNGHRKIITLYCACASTAGACTALTCCRHQPMTFKQGDVIFVQGVLPNGIFRDFENRINPESPPFSSGDLVYIKVRIGDLMPVRTRIGADANSLSFTQKGSGCWTYTHGSGMGVEGFASEDNNFHGIGDLLGIHEFLLPLQVTEFPQFGASWSPVIPQVSTETTSARLSLLPVYWFRGTILHLYTLSPCHA